MSKFYLSIVCLFLFFQIKGQTKSVENTLLFSDDALLKHVKTLSSDAFEGRRTGTKGAIKTQKYIINQFYSLGVFHLGKSYEQPFYFTKGKKEYYGTNILGLVKGSIKPEKYIVISAHYDHEGIKKGQIYNGADDNASGLSALFAFAEYFKKNPPKHSIILAAFDAEELDLQGSKYFLKHPIVPLKQIKTNINLDMISRSDKNELFIVGTAFNKAFKDIIANYKLTEKIKIIEGHQGYDGLENWVYSSDHASFYKKDIPFLYFGVEDHKDYHEPTDDYENIHPKFYIEAVKAIIGVLNKIDQLQL